MIDKAAINLPEEPNIKLNRIELYSQLGQIDEAKKMAAELLKKTWSKYFFAEVPGRLQSIIESDQPEPTQQ